MSSFLVIMATTQRAGLLCAGHCAKSSHPTLNTFSLHNTFLKQLLVTRRNNNKKSTLANVRGNFLEKLTLQRLVAERGRREQKAWVVATTCISSPAGSSLQVSLGPRTSPGKVVRSTNLGAQAPGFYLPYPHDGWGTA